MRSSARPSPRSSPAAAWVSIGEEASVGEDHALCEPLNESPGWAVELGDVDEAVAADAGSSSASPVAVAAWHPRPSFPLRRPARRFDA